MSKIVPHNDKSLNILRVLSLALAGYYLYRAYRKEGTLKGATGKDRPLDFNTDRIVDSVMPWVKVPDHQKEIVTDGLKEFAHNLKEEVLRGKR